MPVQHGGREGAATPGTEGAMFAQVPLWDRDRRPLRGGRPIGDPAMDAGEAGLGPGEPVDAAYETQPAGVGVETGDPPSYGARVGVVVAAVVALAAIAALGWYASRPHGVPELPPGGPEASPIAYVTLAPDESSPPGSATGGDAAKAPAARHAPTPAQPPKDADRPPPRVRPAASANDAAANTSATAAPTITPPSPGSPSTDPMTVNPAPGMRAPAVDSAPNLGSPASAPPPTAEPGTTP